MSVDSALDDRYALWHHLLCDDFGYEQASPVRPPRSANELVFRAVRPQLAPVKAVVVDIRETWLPGDDRAAGLTLHDCFLAAASWHAQIDADCGASGAERLDVERSKPTALIVHRHPFGEHNDVRLPAGPLKHPDAWVQSLEELIAEHYGYLHDLRDEED